MKPFNQLTLMLLLTAGYWLVAARTGDVMSELSIQTSKLRQDILLNLKEPNSFFFNATASMRQMAHRLPESSRGATVRALGKVVRTFVESTTFKQAWLQDIRTYYPYDEAYTDEKLASQTQSQERDTGNLKTQMVALNQAFSQMDPAMLQLGARAQLAQDEQHLASLSGSERAKRAQHIAEVKKMLVLPAAEFKKQYMAFIIQQASQHQVSSSSDVDQEQLAQQRKQKADFDAHADFNPLLKNRLQDFISLAESVDFEARLIPMGYKKEFANPVYRHKPADWKFLYRLGKEPVNEARLFAKQWLADLP